MRITLWTAIKLQGFTLQFVDLSPLLQIGNTIGRSYRCNAIVIISTGLWLLSTKLKYRKIVWELVLVWHNVQN